MKKELWEYIKDKSYEDIVRLDETYKLNIFKRKKDEIEDILIDLGRLCGQYREAAFALEKYIVNSDFKPYRKISDMDINYGVDAIVYDDIYKNIDGIYSKK